MVTFMRLKGIVRAFSLVLISFLIKDAVSNCAMAQVRQIEFNISFSKNLTSQAQDGRLLLLLSTDSTSAPRFEISAGPETALAFGINVNDMEPGEKVRLSSNVFGYPIQDLTDIPAGEYYVQAFLNRYDTYHLTDGRVLKLPRVGTGEGQQWNRKPGNFYSVPVKVAINSTHKSFTIEMGEKIAPIPPPGNTKYVKQIKIRSELLSEFWGRDIYIGASVILPHGFYTHPEAHYPLMIFHGHFSENIESLQSSPPADTLEPIYSERFNWPGYNITQQQEAYEFYKKWTTEGVPLYDHNRQWKGYEKRTPEETAKHYKKYFKAGKPHYIIIRFRHPTPYFDDSYAVNSANTGPYGDALTYELIPYIENKFRGIGEAWSRYTYGGSTGGWEALAALIKYPDDYGGAFASCPDPIDFRAFELVNIYEHDNAYYINSQFKKTERPAHRNYLGQINYTVRDENHMELALGTKSRSGGQWDAWEATFSQVGEDGYPARIWNKTTGEINRRVAQYWKQNYDLRYILQRDWQKGLGEKLKHKIHIYVGDMDNYYLNNAVYLMEEFLEGTTDPYYAGEITYGNRAEHCWNGDPPLPNALSRLHYNTQYLPDILRLMKKQAPEGADLSSWWY